MFRLKLVKDDTHIKFTILHKFFLVLSIIMMITSAAMLYARGLNLGIDFTGGILLEIKTEKTMPISDVRNALSNISAGTPTIQEFGEGELMVKIPGATTNQEKQRELFKEIETALDTKVEFRRVEYVGPQVGKELISVGIKAFVYSLLGIMLYIWFRFEWQFGVAGIIALAHDILAIMLFFTLFRVEFDLTTIAAVLMIAGYSINDTVVIFDRVREAMLKYRKKGLADLLDLSINQMLTRVIITSFTTLVAVLALFLLGTEVIESFTNVILIGIIVGTYSSVFIAGPILLYMNIRKDPA